MDGTRVSVAPQRPLPSDHTTAYNVLDIDPSQWVYKRFVYILVFPGFYAEFEQALQALTERQERDRDQEGKDRNLILTKLS